VRTTPELPDTVYRELQAFIARAENTVTVSFSHYLCVKGAVLPELLFLQEQRNSQSPRSVGKSKGCRRTEPAALSFCFTLPTETT